MILLDTNVISAVMLARPIPEVVNWLDQQRPGEIWTTSVSVFEIRYGLERLADPAKAARLQRLFSALLDEDLGGRIADFDRSAADAAAVLAATRERERRTVDFRDTQIAGIAIALGATIATRNVRHFDDCGQPVINPWEFSGPPGPP